jgi:hypothetical protein
VALPANIQAQLLADVTAAGGTAAQLAAAEAAGPPRPALGVAGKDFPLAVPTTGQLFYVWPGGEPGDWVVRYPGAPSDGQGAAVYSALVSGKVAQPAQATLRADDANVQADTGYAGTWAAVEGWSVISQRAMAWDVEPYNETALNADTSEGLTPPVAFFLDMPSAQAFADSYQTGFSHTVLGRALNALGGAVQTVVGVDIGNSNLEAAGAKQTGVAVTSLETSGSVTAANEVQIASATKQLVGDTAVYSDVLGAVAGLVPGAGAIDKVANQVANAIVPSTTAVAIANLSTANVTATQQAAPVTANSVAAATNPPALGFFGRFEAWVKAELGKIEAKL